VLDLSQIAPLTPAAKDTLSHLIEQGGLLTTRRNRSNAIRLLADPPAAHPQKGCGGHSFSVAS
jgi:hypothetical protein